ncbi:hypothetical protein [Streptomyces sp. NPDC048200]|uniref:hypothetical protein n=1 Tax=Streptomyces sp. NPDC048200 TaxID=3365512 RepID=UPI00371AD962
MAYLFLSYDDCETGGTDPEDGEAVLLIQPGGVLLPGAHVSGPPLLDGNPFASPTQ